MDIHIDPAKPILFFDGEFDEELKADVLEMALRKIVERHPGERVQLDLQKVSRGNSTGIYIFLKVLNLVKAPILFCSTPVWIVLQFNFLAGFLSGDVLVESIQAEYYHEDSDETKVFVVKLGKDIPILPQYNDVNFRYTDEMGKTYEANYSEDYLFFITHWYDKLKRLDSKE